MGLKTLEATLRTTSSAGTRTALLLLGNGIHIQAAAEAGLRDLCPWLSGLRRIAKESGVRDIGTLPSSQPLLWDALVKGASISQGARPSRIHSVLRARLMDHLRLIERQRRSLPLFGRILDLRFENILSLNMDRTLALHSGRETFVAPSWQGDSHFYRHSLIGSAEGSPSRIWYPHGDTHNAVWLRLGTTDYAAELMRLESWRTPMMNNWVDYRVASWSYPGAKPHTKLKTPRRFYEQCRREPLSWYAMTFAAPLVVIGASLPLEDWPTWWLLHQRARNLTPFRKAQVPPTFFLCAKGEALPHMSGGPAELEVVEFPTYDSLWKFVLRK